MWFGFLFIAVLMVLATAVILSPSLILRPSIWFAIALIIQINGAVAFSGDDLFEMIASPALFRILMLLFPLVVLAWAIATPQMSLLAYRYSVGSADPEQNVPGLLRMERSLVFALVMVSIAIVCIYLASVPLRSTGLYVMMTNPLDAMVAREMSFKLVESAWVRYLYGGYCFVIAPVLGALILQRMGRLWSWRGLFGVAFLGLLTLSVMLTGARVAGGALVFVFGVVALLRVGILRGAKILVGSVAALLGLATWLTLLREGQAGGWHPGLFLQYFSGAILHRALVVPLETGIWTNALAQAQGDFGVSAIRPLAALFGDQYVNVANVVGLNYMLNPYSTVSAVTCTIFDYQGAFGYWPGWAISVGLICSLDYFMYCFAELRGRVLVAIFASFLVAALGMISSTYTTVLLSHGMVALAVTGVAVGNWTRRARGH